MYNTSYVHAIIDAVRSHGLHGIPVMVRHLEKRADGIHAGLGEEGPSGNVFRGCGCKDGTETTVLSPHSRNNLEKDAKSFR